MSEMPPVSASAIDTEPPAVDPPSPPPDHWRALFEYAPDGMLLLRPDGAIVDANRAAEKIYGYGRAALLRLRIHDLRDPATMSTIADQLARAASAPDGVSFVSRHRRRDGATFPVDVGSRALTVDGERLLLSVIRDVSEREAVEGRLRRSEERFRSLVEATSVTTWVAKADGWLVDPLARWSTLTGLPPEDLAADPLAAVHPDDVRRGTEAWWAAIRAGAPIEFEQRVRRADGAWRHILVRAAPVRDPDGAVREWIGVDLDVTVRARAEAALREAEARFRATFEQAALGVALCDPDGRWIEFNHAFCAIAGYEPPELRTLTWRDVTHPEDAANEAPIVARMLAGEISGYTIEKRYIRKEGATVWVEVAVALKRAADGRPEYIIGVIADISARRAALASLAAANERFTIAEQASDGFVYDFDLRTGRVERTAGLERVTGYRPEETSGDHGWWQGLIHPDDVDRAQAEGRAAIAEGRAIWSLEYRVRHRDGHDVHVWDRATIVRDAEGTAIKVVGSTVDVTDRARAEGDARFLNRLGAELGLLAEGDEIARVALHATGEYLGVHRCYFIALDRTAGRAVIDLDWCRDDAPSVAGTYRTADFWPPEIWEVLAAGRLTIEDAYTDPRTRFGTERLAPLRIRAYAVVPFVVEGRAAAALTVTDDRPRRWRDDELALLDTVAARVWPLIERARGERSLRESEERFRSLTENMALLVWQMDPNGNPEYLNPYGLAYLGVDLDRYRQMGHAPFLHPDDFASFGEQWEHSQQTGESLDAVFRLRGTNGRYRWFDGHGEAVRDDRGRIVSWVGAAIDIHDRTEAEALVRRHAALLDQASDAIFAWDWGGAITYWNRGASRLYGYAEAEAIGRVSHELLRTVHPLPAAAFLEALERDGMWEGEVTHTTRDGRELAVETRQQLVRDGERVIVLEANRDVSERKDIEAAQQAFLNAVAHDLKNPLAASRAQVQLLRRRIRAGRADLPMVDEALAGLERNNMRLNRRIDELTDAMRLRSGFALDLARRETDLVALLQTNVESSQQATDRHEIRFEATVPVLSIAVDPDRIDRVIDNLLGNAVKYSPAGGPVTVRAWTEETPYGEAALFAIADTGVGIPAADLPRIFEQYHRGSNVEGQIVGSGIGLAGVRQIVAQHGGRVEVASEEGRGSTFTVRLPLRPEPA